MILNSYQPRDVTRRIWKQTLAYQFPPIYLPSHFLLPLEALNHFPLSCHSTYLLFFVKDATYARVLSHLFEFLISEYSHVYVPCTCVINLGLFFSYQHLSLLIGDPAENLEGQGKDFLMMMMQYRLHGSIKYIYRCFGGRKWGGKASNSKLANPLRSIFSIHVK